MNIPVSLLQKCAALVLTGSLVVSAGVAYDKQRLLKQAQIRQKISILRAETAKQEAAHKRINMSPLEDKSLDKEHQPCKTAYPSYEGFADCNSVDPSSTIEKTVQRMHSPIVPISDKAEVHVVGVYLSGRTIVDINYPQHPIVLVLTAYESVKWDIRLHPDTKIERLIISGYYPQRYQGIPESTPVEMYTSNRSTCSTPCWHREGYFYEYDRRNAQARLDRRIQKMTSKRMSSFQGEYAGKSFKINANTHKLTY